MAWIVPAVIGIASLVSQNAQTKAANANNQNQQNAQVANARDQAINAQELMAPWLQAGASPLGKTSVANPTGPLALGAVPGQGASGTQPAPPAPAPQAVMQPPQRRVTQGAPPIGQPSPAGATPGLNPTQLAQIQRIMSAGPPRTLNTAPVTV